MAELFTETKKAIEVAKNIEMQARNSLPYNDKMELLNESKDTAKSREDYEAYEKEIEETKKSQRFDPVHLELSQDEKETIKSNYAIEKEEAQEQYRKTKDKATKILDKAIKDIQPLFNEMARLNNEKGNASSIEPVLNNQVVAKPSVDGNYILSPELEKYPNESIGYKGTLAAIPHLLNDISRAVKQPGKYAYEDTGLTKGLREK